MDEKHQVTPRDSTHSVLKQLVLVSKCFFLKSPSPPWNHKWSVQSALVDLGFTTLTFYHLLTFILIMLLFLINCITVLQFLGDLLVEFCAVRVQTPH